jgi:hypothetical protein
MKSVPKPLQPPVVIIQQSLVSILGSKNITSTISMQIDRAAKISKGRRVTNWRRKY